MATAAQTQEELEMQILDSIQTPLDNLRKSVNQRVIIKLRSGCQLIGELHAYDQHLNMVLGNVDEITQKTNSKRHIPMLYLRGDGVVMVTKESDEIS